MRTDITFPSGDDWCAGWLYRPEGFEGPRPLMVMAHGFSGTKECASPPTPSASARPGSGCCCSITATSAPAAASPANCSTLPPAGRLPPRAGLRARPRLGRSEARRPVRQLVLRRPRARRRGG